MHNFESHIQGVIPVVAEFYADWSDACKLMEPVLQEVKEIAGERAITLRLDIDKYQEIARQYGIYTVPSVAIFKDGQVIWQKSGITAAHEILNHLLLEIE
jgi:thioredoxin 1